MEVYDFGIRLKELREGNHLSQPQLADRLGLTRSAISAYENNLANPPADVLRKLALLYNVSVDYMLGLSDRHCFTVDGLSNRQVELVDKFISFIKLECKSGIPE